MANEFELIGMEELLNKLEKMGKDGIKTEKEALKKAGEVLTNAIKAEIKSSGLVLTENMLNSMKISPVKKKKDTYFVWVGDVDRQATYSWYIEFGTSNITANPFMGRAFEKNKEKIEEIIKEELRKGLGL